MAKRTIERNGVTVDFRGVSSGKQDNCECGNPFTATCDYPVKQQPNSKVWELCNKKMCDDCLVEGVTDGVHFCEKHFQQAKDAYDRKIQKRTDSISLPKFASKEEKRGVSLYAMGLVEFVDNLTFKVITPTLRDKQCSYKVTVEPQGVTVFRCTCSMVIQSSSKYCEHIYAVRYLLEKEVFNEEIRK